MKRFTLTTMIICLPLFTAACNTMAGAGEDISAGGQKIENSAEQNKGY